MSTRKRMWLSVAFIALTVGTCSWASSMQSNTSAAVDGWRTFARVVNAVDDPVLPQYRYYEGSNGGEALVIGVKHSTDIRDQQFGRIADAIAAFRPTLVLNEGGAWAIDSTAERTASLYGEAAYVRFLAIKAGIPVGSLEPGLRAEASFVSQSFGTERTKLYYSLRMLRQEQQRNPTESRQKTEQFMQTLSRDAGLVGIPVSVDEIGALSKRDFGIDDIDQLTPTSFSPVLIAHDKAYEPAENSPILNRLTLQSAIFRDIFMEDLIANQVNLGGRVLVVYGWGHLISQQAELLCKIEQRCAGGDRKEGHDLR
jgi:hypothetical protein